MNNTNAAGKSNILARADHVHPTPEPQDINMLRMFVDQLHNMQLLKAKARNQAQHDIAEKYRTSRLKKTFAGKTLIIPGAYANVKEKP